MIQRLGLLITVPLAAYTIVQLTIRKRSSSTLPSNCPENGGVKEKDGLDEEDEKVNSTNYAINQVDSSPSDLEGEDSLPEFGDLSREPEHLLLDGNKEEHETQMENINMAEMERSLKLLMELEKKNVELEDELLMYYRLKDRKADISELQNQLKIQNEDIDMLKITITSLKFGMENIQKEVMECALMKKELEVARSKIKELQRQIQLDAKQRKEHLLLLKQQVADLQAKEEGAVKKEAEIHKKLKAVKDLEAELGELKRKNQELQHETEELTNKLDIMKVRITTLSSITESEIVTREGEEARKLRCANEDLIKQVERLQTNRFGEVEELVFLRWVNACLRYELRNNQKPSGKISACDLNKSLSPKSKEKAKKLILEYAELEFGQANTDPEHNFSDFFSHGIDDFNNTSTDSSTSRISSSIEKPNLNPTSKKLSSSRGGSNAHLFFNMLGASHRWRQAIPESPEALTLSGEPLNSVATSLQMMSESIQENLKEKCPAYRDRQKIDVSEREKRIKEKANGERAEKFGDISSENYQTLMKKKANRKTLSSPSLTTNAFDAGSNMVGEIEKISSSLLAVKTDVETQGDLVKSLAMEVRSASFSNMEDLVSFVIWLDEELSFLVDERAVLRHFDWPEGKTDALREAASEYQDLMKLAEQVSSFVDNPKLSCEVALKKMCSLLDKVEQSVYAVLCIGDMTISRYKEFGIPVDWLLDSGLVGKINLSSVQLARKFMKRIVHELDALGALDKESNREFLLLQGVHFAFRVHQFAGGFDAESMKAFEELRSRVHNQVGENKLET